MANEITKPSSLSNIWASGGDRIKPSDEKIQLGWQVEIPPYQHENWIQNRQDQALGHINQYGIPHWDIMTEYVAGKSYVQGSDGFIYKALVDNIGVEPSLDPNTWMLAFVSLDNDDSLKFFNGYTIISSDFSVLKNTRYYAINSITITLPQTATNGDNIIINKAPNAEVTIVVQGGGMISTKLGLYDEVVHDWLDELNVTWNGASWQTS